MQKTKHLFILITLLFICFSAATEAEINIQTNDKNISKGNSEGKAVPLIPSEQGEHATDEEDKSINNKNRSDYLIKGKDILHITVYDEPDLSYDSNTNRSLRVSVDGKISFPLLGDVKAVGLTPFQLEKKTRTTLKRRVSDKPARLCNYWKLSRFNLCHRSDQKTWPDKFNRQRYYCYRSDFYGRGFY